MHTLCLFYPLKIVLFYLFFPTIKQGSTIFVQTRFLELNLLLASARSFYLGWWSTSRNGFASLNASAQIFFCLMYHTSIYTHQEPVDFIIPLYFRFDFVKRIETAPLVLFRLFSLFQHCELKFDLVHFISLLLERKLKLRIWRNQDLLDGLKFEYKA